MCLNLSNCIYKIKNIQKICQIVILLRKIPYNLTYIEKKGVKMLVLSEIIEKLKDVLSESTIGKKVFDKTLQC